MEDGTPRIVTNLGLHWLEYTDGKVIPAWPQLELLLRLLQEKGLCGKTSSSFSTFYFCDGEHPPQGSFLALLMVEMF